MDMVKVKSCAQSTDEVAIPHGCLMSPDLAINILVA